MNSPEAQSATSDLPPIPAGFAIAVGVLLITAHVLAMLLFFSHCPVDTRRTTRFLTRAYLSLRSWVVSLLSQSTQRADEPERGIASSQQSFPERHSEQDKPKPIDVDWPNQPSKRWPFTSATTSIADDDGAWSTSISPIPLTTPTPIRRFISSSYAYSPSIHPAESPAKKGWEMLSPSVYTPGTNGSAIIQRLKESKTMERPKRYYNEALPFVTTTPESMVSGEGSIVIGLGLGLSPLQFGAKSASTLGQVVEEEASIRTVIGRDSAACGFATPLTEVEGNDADNETEVNNAVGELRCRGALRSSGQTSDGRLAIFRGMDYVVALVGDVLANLLDGEVGPSAEDGLLFAMHSSHGFSLEED